MSLNGGFILTPDVHPETLPLAELPQSSLGVGVGWVGLAVLLLPGLNKSSEDPAPESRLRPQELLTSALLIHFSA